MLYHDDFEQHYRVYAWAAIILTVQLFHKIINVNEIYSSIHLSEQMISGYKILHTQYLYHPTSKFLLLVQHLLFSSFHLFFYFTIYI